MVAQKRYSSLVPEYYWLDFPHTRFAVWTGPKHFYVQSVYQAAKGPTDTASGIPSQLPQWDQWIQRFHVPAGTAYNHASGLRFTFWISASPTYAFAMKAERAQEQVGMDVHVRTIPDLEQWAVAKGLHPGDRQSAGTGGFIGSLSTRAINFVLHYVPLALSGFIFTPETYRDWKMWGGEYPS